MPYISRHIESKISEAMSDTPIIVISGPRQAGKSTLAEQFIHSYGTHLTLDDPSILAASISDPIGLLKDLAEPILIDEVQRNPLLLPVIKALIDKNRQPGRFILTGSANLLTIPKITESLAGRAEIIELLPLAQSEINGHKGSALDLLFYSSLDTQLQHTPFDINSIITKGGYPEVQNRHSKRAVSWFNSYIKAMIQRDIKEVFEIKKIRELSQMLKVLAALNACLVSANGISSKVSLDHKTVRKYISALENLYLIREIPAWSRNELSKATKQSKINFIDSGLLCAIKGITKEKLQKDSNLIGNIFESFIFSELLKQANASDEGYTFFHYRDTRKNEVDLIIENAFGDAIGVEIKSTHTASQALFKGLDQVNRQVKLKRSIVIYRGDKLLSFGDNKWVVPASMIFNS